jgi:hypothetical protein
VLFETAWARYGMARAAGEPAWKQGKLKKVEQNRSNRAG